MSCEGVQQDEYDVHVKFLPPLKKRCREACTRFCNTSFFVGITFCQIVAYLIFFLGLLAFVSFSQIWIPILMGHCHKPPGIELQNFTIRALEVYQNNATSTPDWPWQVDSAFNATFSTWDRNTVAGCFNTLRTMVVHVNYRDNLILRQEIQLGYSLKPRGRRPVSLELKGDHFPLKKNLGPHMEAELRGDNITVELFFDTRYLIADRRSYWLRYGCTIVAKTPKESTGLGSFLNKRCFLT